MSSYSKSEKVARNIASKHGADKLRFLLDGFCKGESGQVLADALGVTRERVRQWRDILTSTTVTVEVSPDVQSFLRNSDY